MQECWFVGDQGIEKCEWIEAGECDHLTSSLENVGHGHIHSKHMVQGQDTDCYLSEENK